MSRILSGLKKFKQDDLERLHIYSDKQLLESLGRYCKEHGVSRSALITALVRDYLKKEGHPITEIDEEKSVCIPSDVKSS